MRPYLEKTHRKERAHGMAEGVGPEFKSLYHEKKKIQSLKYLWSQAFQKRCKKSHVRAKI
jgi:hypothetical protein